MNLGGILLLFTLFKENYAGIVEEESGDDGSSTNSGVSTLPSYDKLAGFICYLTRFTVSSWEILIDVFYVSRTWLSERTWKCLDLLSQ